MRGAQWIDGDKAQEKETKTIFSCVFAPKDDRTIGKRENAEINILGYLGKVAFYLPLLNTLASLTSSTWICGQSKVSHEVHQANLQAPTDMETGIQIMQVENPEDEMKAG